MTRTLLGSRQKRIVMLQRQSFVEVVHKGIVMRFCTLFLQNIHKYAGLFILYNIFVIINSIYLKITSLTKINHR